MSGTATRVAPEGLARRHHPPTLLNLSLINVRTLLNMDYLSHYYAELLNARRLPRASGGAIQAPEPRAETAELLDHFVHPRLAMASCVYFSFNSHLRNFCFLAKKMRGGFRARA